MFTHKIISGNRAAVITANDESGPFSCRLWVNVRDGLEDADATLVSTKRRSLNGAVAWARKQLDNTAA
jgi:hypothetical protein